MIENDDIIIKDNKENKSNSKNNNKKKKDKNINNNKQIDIDKYDDEEEEHGSRFMSILKFIKSLKLSLNTNITNITVPAYFISNKPTIAYFVDGVTSHFDILLKANNITDKFERFLQVYRCLASTLFNISAYEKSLNPILGETLSGSFEFLDENKNIEMAEYKCEVISHNPIIIVGIIYSKKHDIRVHIQVNIKVLFMGTYAKVVVDDSKIRITLGKFGNEVYEQTVPPRNVHFLRGFSEICGESITTSNNSNYKIITKHIEKGLIGGDYNLMDCKIMNTETNTQEYNISGKWSNELKIKNLKSNEKPSLFFRRPECSSIIKLNQDNSLSTDSYVVWKGVFDAHNLGNNKLKSIEKSKVEKYQRQLREERKRDNIEWKPKHFIKDDLNNYWELL